MLPESKKSLFYSFISKSLVAVYSLQEEKAFRIVDKSKEELKKSFQEQKHSKHFSLDTYAKVVAGQSLVKNFLNAIMLLMISPKGVSPNMSKR